MKKIENIVVLGLGYVGINLASLFAKSYRVIGYDVDCKKIEDYKSGYDVTGEIGEKVNQLGIEFTADPNKIKEGDAILVCVPTPSLNGLPDTTILASATETIAKYMKANSIIIYSSTVYPGFTQKELLPILETNNQKEGKDFHLAYVPERVSPGTNIDISKIAKVISANDDEVLQQLHTMFGTCFSNIHLVSHIEVAEAAKVLENTQRDVNIALLNEFRMGYPDIPFDEVEAAMGTKWNALNFSSGLVGGHCIAEDPYYIIHGAKLNSRSLSVVEAARACNERYYQYFIDKIQNILSGSAKILIKGITYKANVPDIRNSQVMKIVDHLKNSQHIVTVMDPILEYHNVSLEMLQQSTAISDYEYDVIVYAVAHESFLADEIQHYLDADIFVVDINAIFATKHRDHTNYIY